MLAWTGGTNPEDDALAKQYSPRVMDSPYGAAARAAPAAYAPADVWTPPKKNHDALAEAWGIHEPEPYEEFFAGGGSKPDSAYASRNGSAHAVGGGVAPGRRSKDREAYRDHLDDAAQQGSAVRRNGTKTRNTLPPPKPIFVPEGDSSAEGPPSPTTPGVGSPGAPKRTKSLMNRIRRMRDNPNMPVGYDDYGALGTSPPNSADLGGGGYRSDGPSGRPSRPTHRAQNSFLGKIGGRGGAKESSTSPTSDNSDFVYVGYDDGRARGAANKDLPATPAGAPEMGYFDGAGGSGNPSSPGGGLGRKTSLLKKVKGAMRGGAKSVERR
jgi:hypothetical protein